jgi:hypothetical protein
VSTPVVATYRIGLIACVIGDNASDAVTHATIATAAKPPLYIFLRLSFWLIVPLDIFTFGVHQRH